jgi:hypothetical protein
MCDANDYAVRVVVDQCYEKKIHAIYYASKVFNEKQGNYSTVEKELLGVVFALENF